MVEIRNKQGQVIRRSRNLRGILDHARRVGLDEACAYPRERGRGLLCVAFADGSTCQTEFADYTVLCWWLQARRSWAGVRRIDGGDRVGE